ncbi:MAG: hydroxymethylbilane synthase, partial [Hyphomicrobiaceae bacterium]|nr:hydroxymethylbilane synthase [Hyphomicrobiaceae bacterium]
LDGSCRTPIAGLAEWNGAQINFRGEILAPDGARRLTTARTGPTEGLVAAAQDAARELLVEAGADFFTERK